MVAIAYHKIIQVKVTFCGNMTGNSDGEHVVWQGSYVLCTIFCGRCSIFTNQSVSQMIQTIALTPVCGATYDCIMVNISALPVPGHDLELNFMNTIKCMGCLQ